MIVMITTRHPSIPDWKQILPDYTILYRDLGRTAIVSMKDEYLEKLRHELSEFAVETSSPIRLLQ